MLRSIRREADGSHRSRPFDRTAIKSIWESIRRELERLEHSQVLLDAAGIETSLTQQLAQTRAEVNVRGHSILASLKPIFDPARQRNKGAAETEVPRTVETDLNHCIDILCKLAAAAREAELRAGDVDPHAARQTSLPQPLEPNRTSPAEASIHARLVACALILLLVTCSLISISRFTRTAFLACVYGGLVGLLAPLLLVVVIGFISGDQFRQIYETMARAISRQETHRARGELEAKAAGSSSGHHPNPAHRHSTETDASEEMRR